MKIDDLKSELSVKGNELATWRSLVENAGWALFKATMEQQRKARLFMVGETPLRSFGETLGQEFMKGEGAGIGLSLMLPLTQIELLTLDVERLSTAIEMEASNATKTEGIDGSGGNSDFSSRVDDNDFSGGDD